jgi:hypothetical protein
MQHSGRLQRFSALLALLAASASALGADVYVVARADSKVSLDEVREVYLGEKEFSRGVRLIPVDNQSAQAEFTVKALAMDAQRYSQLWVKKAFRDALTPPALLATDAEVTDFVKRNRGAIGYLLSAPRDKDLIVIGKY